MTISEKELRSMLSAVPVGIFTTDFNGSITFWNQAAEDMTGYKRTEISGNLCRYFLPARPDTPAKNDELCSVFCGGKLRNCECFFKHKNGTLISILMSSSLLTDQVKKPVGIVGTMTDITYFHNIEEQYKSLSQSLANRYSFGSIIGRSEPMRRVYHMLERAAESDATVLLLGESGTGKELAARAIHYNSGRKDKVMVTVNCSAFPETLLESELFGHVKGAFTGALRDKEGRFEVADGGTIFLDEIGDISPLIQVKLLRVLQTKTIERLGDHTSKKIDARIVTATNRDLTKMLSDGTFREDLYYRLKVFPVTLPPLRERKEDIPLLIDYFIGRFNESTGKSIKGVDPEALKYMLDYCWPGNVRELENAIEHAYVLCRSDSIQISDLPHELFSENSGRALCKHGQQLSPKRHEKEMLIEALQQAGGNRSLAAQLLDVSRVTVWKRMKRYGLL
ncbi:MAG: sigma 54-interacting transcriptional regulator [Candidatus Auribacterota bacterium]